MEKSLLYQLFHLLGIDTDLNRRILIAMPLMPILIQQSEADPTRSGSTTQDLTIIGCSMFVKAILNSVTVPIYLFLG
jgi:hypothetical protein